MPTEELRRKHQAKKRESDAAHEDYVAADRNFQASYKKLRRAIAKDDFVGFSSALFECAAVWQEQLERGKRLNQVATGRLQKELNIQSE